MGINYSKAQHKVFPVETEINVVKLYTKILNVKSFDNYAVFKKWLEAIPDAELKNLFYMIQPFDMNMKTDRLYMEKVIRRWLIQNITEYMFNKKNEMMKPVVIPPPFEYPPIHEWALLDPEEILNIQNHYYYHEQIRIDIRQKALDDKLQIIHDIYSVFVPMLDLYRIEDDHHKARFEESLKSQVAVCYRLEKEMDDVANPLRIQNRVLEKNIRTIFQEMRKYQDEYTKEIVEYNRRRRNTLLLKTGMNRDVFLHIVSFMSNDQPPITA